jgi:DNA primase
VSCIFIGNWMLLNLFLAILLDSFTQVEEEDMMTPEKKERIKAQMLEDLKIKEGEDFIEGMDELHRESFNISTEKTEKKKKKKKKTGKKKQGQANQSSDGEDKKPVGNILEES